MEMKIARMRGKERNELSDKWLCWFFPSLSLHLYTEADWFGRRLIRFSIHLIFLFTTSLTYLYIYIMKQSSMFHKFNLDHYAYDKDSDDDHDNNDNPVGSIIAAIQKQQAKKKARLPKNNISDPMGVMVHNFIRITGVHANAAKRIIMLLSNKSKYDPKVLSNMSELLQTNRLEPLALMFVATLDYYKRSIKTDNQHQQHIQCLENTFKNIAQNIMQSSLKIKLSSMAQEFHATFCDIDLDPKKADKNIEDRFNVLKQQLQHQLDNTYQFDSTCPCLRHNLTPPCKIKNCPWPHICRCGAMDHIMSDRNCPKYHLDDDKFFKKIKGMNTYHAKRANKASKYDKWKNYGPYPNNNNQSHNQSPNNNRNDNNDNNRYNNRQRR